MTEYHIRSLSMASGDRSHYALYLPRTEPPRDGWPVILSLHGAGERGTDTMLTTQVGLGHRIEQREEDFPCIVVFPQCAFNQLWVDADMMLRATAALDVACAEFNVDVGRVYLTGISMGGFGAWLLASQQPERFAAAVCVCGGFPEALGESGLDEAVYRLRYLPVWAFHGVYDDIIPVGDSRRVVERLRQAGGDVHYTEYGDLSHNSWDRAYAEPGLWPWVFDKHKKLTRS